MFSFKMLSGPKIFAKTDTQVVIKMNEIKGSHLYILQSQVLSTAPSTCTEIRPPSHHNGEDSQNAFHCCVNIDVEVIAMRRQKCTFAVYIKVPQQSRHLVLRLFPF